jgi:hypothetical protein
MKPFALPILASAGLALAVAASGCYSLSIGSPAQTYYLNNGTDYTGHCIPIDYQQTVQMDAGAAVTLYASTVDGLEIRNLDEAGDPIVVAGISPSPSAYDGQFIQVDVVSIVPRG